MCSAGQHMQSDTGVVCMQIARGGAEELHPRAGDDPLAQRLHPSQQLAPAAAILRDEAFHADQGCSLQLHQQLRQPLLLLLDEVRLLSQELCLRYK